MDGKFRVDQWLVQPQLNLIQGPGGDTSVEPKAMEVLVCLSQRPGEVVPKERLMQTVWPDTFVTDEVLTNSIWELRKAFGDDARNPKVIQTVFKKGYRLIAPVAWHNHVELSAPRAQPTAAQAGGKATPALRWWIVVGVTVATIAGAAFGLRLWPPSPASTPPVRPVPLTSLPGSEILPALSPDGNQVAFAWSRSKGENYDIYLKVVGAETHRQLSNNPANEVSPAWSADGRHIAFLRLSEAEQAIVIVDALGGTERLLASTETMGQPGRGQTRFWGQTLSWSPDGKFLAVAERQTESLRIIMISVENGQKRILHNFSIGFTFQTPSLSFSPDGLFLAFAGPGSSNIPDIYLFPVSAGEPKRLTFTNRFVYGLDWTHDSCAVIYSMGDVRGFHLWRVGVSGEEPELLSWTGEGALSPSVSRRRNSMAYVQSADDLNIWKFDVASSPPHSSSTPVVSSTRLDSNPKFSPDGKRILFMSTRSGGDEFWICDSDGSSPRQLTSLDLPAKGSQRWSPDAEAIAFDSNPEGHRDVYVVAVTGGKVTRLTHEQSQDVRPSWSRDGRWIYFGSNRTGQYEVWKLPSTGGAAVQVTRQGGREALESADGKFLYFSKGGEGSGLWKMPVDGKDAVKILEEPRQGYWDVNQRGIYFLAYSTGAIKFHDLDRNRTTVIMTVEGEVPWGIPGFSVSPDGRQILLSLMDRFESDLMLVENFR